MGFDHNAVHGWVGFDCGFQWDIINVLISKVKPTMLYGMGGMG